MTRTVLIVDDSPTIRKMVRASLRLIDAEFVEAGNGLEAIEQISFGAPALIILDLNMPDMHGIDVLKFVRGHQAGEGVPVLVLTTRDDAPARNAALAAGATRYLTKPFVPSALLEAAQDLAPALRSSR